MVGGILGGGWLLRLVLVGFLVIWEWRGYGVSLGVGFGGCGLASEIWGLGVVSEVG